MDTQTPMYSVVMQHLRAKQIPQRKVAAASGVPFSTLTKIAQGQIKAPSVHHVQALHDYFVKAGAAPVEPASPLRALACATQSVRLTADRRDADRRELARRVEPVDAPQPNQLPLAIEAGERYWEAE